MLHSICLSRYKGNTEKRWIATSIIPFYFSFPHWWNISPTSTASPPPPVSLASVPLSSRHHAPGPDLVVCVASEQGLAVGAPRQRHALGLAALLALLNELRLELIDLALLLEIEDSDAAASSSAQPVSVRREHQGVDLVTRLQGVQVLRLVQIPQHRRAILTTGGAERAIGRDGHSVDVASVANVIGLEAARGKFPNL